ncbi:MAG: EF-hand domain-containing protein [Bryobacteraceae bacterium]
MSPVVTILDADRDGAISADEIAKASVSLMKLDKDHDGMLSLDEVRPNFGEGRGRGGREGGPGGPGGPGGMDPAAMTKRLLEFDRNGDGTLSKDEIPERMQGMIARGDLDKDGSLSAEELKKMAEAPGPGARGSGRERPEGRGGPEGFRRMDPVMAALDADHDGNVSKSEIAGASKALAKLDRDRDGQLTPDEIRPEFGGGRGRGNPAEMVSHIFEERDANGDGQLSKDEMPPPMQENFSHFDANNDGLVSKKEMTDAMGRGGFGPGPRGRR